MKQDSLEDKLFRIRECAASCPKLSLNQIISLLGPSSNYLVILFLIVPFLQPVPIPILSTISGLSVAWLGLLIAFKKNSSTPKWAESVYIQSNRVLNVTEKMSRLFHRTHKWIHERRLPVNRSVFSRLFNGSLICVLGVLLAIPLPIPFTNTLPALSLLFLCVGSLQNDLLVICGGYVCTAATFAYFSTITIVPLKLILE